MHIHGTSGKRSAPIKQTCRQLLTDKKRNIIIMIHKIAFSIVNKKHSVTLSLSARRGSVPVEATNSLPFEASLSL